MGKLFDWQEETGPLAILREEVQRYQQRLADCQRSHQEIARLLRELEREIEDLRAARRIAKTGQEQTDLDRLIWGCRLRQDQLYAVLSDPGAAMWAEQNLREAEHRLAVAGRR
jgi:hypothetical protein